MNSIMDSIAGGLSVIKAPIIIPFAPRYFGKTCLLYRLIHFIRNYGFQVELATWFVSSHSIFGENECNKYMESVGNGYSPFATAIPILGKLIWQGNIKALFVDFPGDFLYNIDNPCGHSSALKEILSSPNKKIWLFILELDRFMKQDEQANYSEKIRSVATHITPNDKIIIVVNKIDICSASLKSKEDLVQAIYHQYPTVLNCFKNKNPVTKLWRPFNCDIIPFTAGLFCRTYDNKEMFQPGLDTYPKQLWKAISKGLH